MQKREIQAILTSIPTGSQNAIHADELARQAGTDPRTIRKIIADARINGETIIGDSHGYYRPGVDDYENLKRAYFAGRKRAISSFRGLKSTRVLLRTIETNQALQNMQQISEELNGAK